MCRIDLTATILASATEEALKPSEDIENVTQAPQPSTTTADDTNAKPEIAVQQYSHAITFNYTPPGALDAVTDIPPTSTHVQSADGNLSSTREISVTDHSSLLVDEPFIRSFATTGGTLTLMIKLARTALGPGSEGEPTTVQCELSIDLASLLVGDKEVSRRWGLSEGDIQMPEVLRPWVECVGVVVSCWKQVGAPPVAEGQQPERESTDMLPVGLSKQLNPIVFNLSSVQSLPDLPAKRAVLDSQCYLHQIRCKPDHQKVYVGVFEMK